MELREVTFMITRKQIYRFNIEQFKKLDYKDKEIYYINFLRRNFSLIERKEFKRYGL